MTPLDHHELIRGLRLAAIAVVSALVTATLVIGAGSVWLMRLDGVHQNRTDVQLVLTSG